MAQENDTGDQPQNQSLENRGTRSPADDLELIRAQVKSLEKSQDMMQEMIKSLRSSLESLTREVRLVTGTYEERKDQGLNAGYRNNQARKPQSQALAHNMQVPDAPSGARSRGLSGMKSNHPRQNLKTKLKDARRRLTRALNDPDVVKDHGYMDQLWISYWNRVANFTTSRSNILDLDPQAESWNKMVSLWKQRMTNHVPDPRFREYPDVKRLKSPKSEKL